MSGRSMSRQNSVSRGPMVSSKGTIPEKRTNTSFGKATRITPGRQGDSWSALDASDRMEHKRVPSLSACRQASPSPSRSALSNTVNSVVTLTPSEKRCCSCSRLAVQFEEFNSRQSTPVRQMKSRSPSPAPKLGPVSPVPSPPSIPTTSPAVDHRQRLVVAPTPPPFSPHQDFPYERDDKLVSDVHKSPAVSRPNQFQPVPDEVDYLSNSFSPTISLPSPSKPPVYPAFTPPKPPALEPLFPARRRELPTGGDTLTLNTTFNSPDKGVWVPSSPLRGTSFNRSGCPYLTRSLSPNHTDRKLTSPVKTPAMQIPPTKPKTDMTENMYDHSVVLATPSSKPARKGAPTESDTLSLSGTHSLPAKHGSSGVYNRDYHNASGVTASMANNGKARERSADIAISAHGESGSTNNSVYQLLNQSNTPAQQDQSTTQVVFIPVQVPPARIQQTPLSPLTQYTNQSQFVPPQGYAVQQVSQPFTPPPPTQSMQYVQSSARSYAWNAPNCVPPPAPAQLPAHYVQSGYNVQPSYPTMYSVVSAPYPYALNTMGMAYPYAAAPAPPAQYSYLYSAPHPVDTWWTDQIPSNYS